MRRRIEFLRSCMLALSHRGPFSPPPGCGLPADLQIQHSGWPLHYTRDKNLGCGCRRILILIWHWFLRAAGFSTSGRPEPHVPAIHVQLQDHYKNATNRQSLQCLVMIISFCSSL